MSSHKCTVSLSGCSVSVSRFVYVNISVKLRPHLNFEDIDANAPRVERISRERLQTCKNGNIAEEEMKQKAR
jgi:hypothetical protein